MNNNEIICKHINATSHGYVIKEKKIYKELVCPDCHKYVYVDTEQKINEDIPQQICKNCGRKMTTTKIIYNDTYKKATQHCTCRYCKINKKLVIDTTLE